MSNTLLLKRSATPGGIPSAANVALGELAINTYDGRLFTKIDTGTPAIYELTQNQPITALGNVTGVSVNGVGYTNITLTLSNTGVSAGTYGGTSGATSNIGVFTVDQYGRITSASNVAISTSSLANGTSNIELYANGNISINPAGTANVAVFATTGEYVTGLLSVTGNVVGGNVTTGGLVTATGNVTGGNVSTAGAVTATGNVTGGNIITAGQVSATGNISGSYLLGNGALITGLPANYGNTQVAEFLPTYTGNLVSLTGPVVTTANITGGNLITSGLITATGNVTGGNVNTAGVITATGNVTGGNVNTAGLITATGNVTGGNVNTAGVITATGNVTGGNLTTSGILSVSGNTNVATVNVAGNIVPTANAVYDLGSSSLRFKDLFLAGNSLVLGEQTVSANASGVALGGVVFGSGAVITGNITATSFVSATGNVIGGNVTTAGLVTATGNVSGGNVNTAGLMSATGNVIGGNVSTAGQVTATGNVTGGNLVTGGLVTATGAVTSAANVTGANVNTAGLVSATGNVIGGNVSTGGQVTATGNITGGNVNTGGVVSATGNVQGGNVVTGGQVTATGNVSGANFVTGGIVSAAGNITGGNVIAVTGVTTGNVTSTGSMTIATGSGNLTLNPTGNINVNSKYINSLATPVQATDAATKQYVDDSVSAGLTIHTPVYVESPTNLTATYADGGTTATATQISGNKTLLFGTSLAPIAVNDVIVFTASGNGITAGVPYFVYSTDGSVTVTLSASFDGVEITTLTNGSGLSLPARVNSGVGATLTNAAANAAIQIDGVTLSATQRVLVYTQTNAFENGVYTVTTVGNASTRWQLTRSTDTNTYGPKSINQLDAGDYFYVQAGATGTGESYVLTAPTGTIIFGTSNITFTQFSASQTFSANTSAGLTLSGTTLSAKVDNDTTAFDGGGNIIVKASANLVTPNIGAAVGNSVSVTGNVTGGNVNTGGLITATGNITGGNIATAGLATVTGNITGGNINTGGQVSATANVTGGNLITAGLISAGGTINGANLQLTDTANVANIIVRTFANVTATTTSTSNVTGALRVAGGVGVTGNVYADGMYVLGDSVLTINSTIDCGTY